MLMWSVWVLTPQYSDGDTILSKKHHPSDEVLTISLKDRLWSLKIPGCPLKKSRGVTSASWPNLPIGWCVVGVLAQSGCRCFIQVDAAHWWWLRRFPPFHVTCFEYPEKHYINVTNYYYKMCFQQGFLNIYFRYLNFNLPQVKI